MLFQRILLTVNDDTFSQKPARMAFELAKAMQAEVAVIHVVDYRLLVTDPETTGIMPNDTLQLIRKEAETTVDKIVKEYAGNMMVTRFITEGRPTAEILSKAEEWKADLIVMGTHGKSGLLMLLQGSVSQYIEHHASVPVLVVPTKATKE